jgi:hypothetical protein
MQRGSFDGLRHWEGEAPAERLRSEAPAERLRNELMS